MMIEERKEKEMELIEACYGGDAEKVRSIIKSWGVMFPNSETSYALSVACGKGNLEIVNMLLDAGASISYDSHLSEAILLNRIGIVKLLIDKHALITHHNKGDLLRSASNMGHTEILRMLLGEGEFTHTEINQANNIASKRALSIDTVRLLADYGADLDEALIEICGSAGEEKKRKSIEMLLEVGANPNHALRWACINGREDVVLQILSSSAKSFVDLDTALELASEGGHLLLVKMLLMRDANPMAKGGIAFRRAEDNGHTEIAEILQNWKGYESKLEIYDKCGLQGFKHLIKR